MKHINELYKNLPSFDGTKTTVVINTNNDIDYLRKNNISFANI